MEKNVKYYLLNCVKIGTKKCNWIGENTIAINNPNTN